MFQRSWKTIPGEKGYPLLFFYVTKTWLLAMLVTLIVVATAGGFYLWYSQFGNDVAPDSIVGLIFASAGTLCFILSAMLYMRHRRSQRRKAGQLNASLHWHIFLAIMSLALLLMHSFGNFNARSGTYALYSLVALVVSGFVGRLLDRIMSRLLAAEVAKTITVQEKWEQGWDSREQGWGREQGWDKPQPLLWTTNQFVFQAPVAPPIWTPEAILRQMQRAAQREEFYRSVIRYWRIFHVMLALVAVGLIVWHLVFVVQLMVFHNG